MERVQMAEGNPLGGQPDLAKCLLDMAVDSWRFGRLFERALSALDAGEQKRYLAQFRWFQRRMEESLGEAGMRFVNIEGHPFDPGMAATALNIEEFDAGDALVVDQMIEPIVMGPEGIIRTGTVTLRRMET
jgi:alkylation response protein AidB-like acyl-CoA dehydrogenase